MAGLRNETGRETAFNVALLVVFALLQLGLCAAQDLYIVVLKQPSVITYDGSISGYPATRPKQGERFDASTKAATAYTKFLRRGQADVLRTISNKKPIYSVTNSINALTLTLSDTEVRSLQRHPNVLAVVKSRMLKKAMTYTPRLLNLPNSQWKAVGGQKNAGEGIVIGVIDSGIYPEHPSFKATGYAPLKGWKGKCMATRDFKCNNKIISAAYFLNGLEQAVLPYDKPFNRSAEFISVRAKEGHGVHTAATAAGNAGVPITINGVRYGMASGIAPRARLGIYKALWDDGYYAGGTDADIVMAIDRAISDGCNVLSYSVGGPPLYGSRAFLEPIELQFLAANRAGILVASAAGNSGPGSTDKAGPWYLSVGSSNTPRTFSRSFTVKGPKKTSVTLDGFTISDGPFTGRILQVPDVAMPFSDEDLSDRCSSTFFDMFSVRGNIIVCLFEGLYDTRRIVSNLGGLGATAVIFKSVPDPTIFSSASSYALPVTFLDTKATTALFKYINGALKSLTNSKGCTNYPPPPPDWWIAPGPDFLPFRDSYNAASEAVDSPSLRRRLLEINITSMNDIMQEGPMDAISYIKKDHGSKYYEEMLSRAKQAREELRKQQPKRILAQALPCKPTTKDVAFTAVIGGVSVRFTATAPSVSFFSSTGPNPGNANILKPDILAPGEVIMAAWSPQAVEDPGLFIALSGTSMATPHVAGILALLKQQYKTWSPPAIYSYLLTRATTINNRRKPITTKAFANAPATSIDMGHGFINPSNLTKPGLVHDLDFSAYTKFLCSLGIDANVLFSSTGMTCRTKSKPWDLNVPSITASPISTKMSFRRTVTNRGPRATYRVTITPPQGFVLQVSPTSFTLNTGGKATYRVVLTPKLALAKYVSGSISWSSGAGRDTIRIPVTALCNFIL